MQIKKHPEDFLVKEISTVKLSKGDYAYFLFKKKNYTTEDAIQRIAEATKINRKRLGYAGNKDKNAITEQTISVFKAGKELEKLELKDIELKLIGNGEKPISLGDLKANRFEILVRNAKKPRRIYFIPNYFDEQRFSKNNCAVGKLLLQKKFKQAAELIEHKRVKDYLLLNPNDSIGAIRTLPKKILTLYLHAYQSFLFNETVNEYIKSKKHKITYSLGYFIFPEEKIKNIKIPIIGFGTEEKEIIKKIIDKEKIKPRDFIIREIPEISAEGDKRDLIVEVKNLKVKEEGKNYRVFFELQKGSYATLVIKGMFK